jgi:hypothetical protein
VCRQKQIKMTSYNKPLGRLLLFRLVFLYKVIIN